MSVEVCNYICPQCGYKEERIPEGISMLGAYEYMVFKCCYCRILQSERLTKQNEEFFRPFRCRHCNTKGVVIWDHKCPQCGGELKRELLHMDN